ncbi:WD40 repeat-like protein [Pleurostoma richardsiae]|uniref:WD40 repeat-like protein n=1 Tax=Pleurostoma richardsiae TaxID=41990 RepID=A0AA38VVJ8_9PEZI|nr:WD40 repeat-like protein [Pleurostoma richardsiae]
MNTRPAIERPNTPAVLSVAFNDDSSFFTVALETGFCIFHSNDCQMKTSRDFNAGIGLVQMMGKSNILALVGGGRQPKFAQNKVILWDDAKAKGALEITTLTAIRGVRLARNRIIIVLQNSVRIYSFAKPPDLVATYETANNLLGLCCPSERVIAFPGRTPGQVQMVEISTGNVSIIPAHSSALRAISISPDGELLATASETGTLLRVFATSNCAKIAELRRGVDPATIFSLAFSPSGTMLACTSDKSTLHIFDVPHPKKPPRESSSPRTANFPAGGGSAVASPADDGKGKWGILGKIPFMPRVFSDVYSFATASFEAGDEPMVGGLPMSEGTTLGTSRPPKGIIGWIDEENLLVIGAGRDARWERFTIAEGEDGRRFCVRAGWKRYLGNN